MFGMKPILVDQNIELPSCMYSLKPVSGISGENEPKNSAKNEIEQLEEKQSRILKKLDELKQSLMLMRGDLKLCNKPFQPPQQKPSSEASSSSRKSPIDVRNLGDVVINVNPQQIPFGILALKNQWNGRLNLDCEVFTHSSVNDAQVSEAARTFAMKIAAQSSEVILPTLKVTLIWKDVEIAQLITSPVIAPIFGEVNIIRYFNRIGPSEFFYEAGDNHATSISDAIFDTCYELSRGHPIKERQKFVQILSQRLDKNQFFSGTSHISVVDIAVASTFEKLFGRNLKELPANLSSWLKKTASAAGY